MCKNAHFHVPVIWRSVGCRILSSIMGCCCSRSASEGKGHDEKHEPPASVDQQNVEPQKEDLSTMETCEIVKRAKQGTPPSGSASDSFHLQAAAGDKKTPYYVALFDYAAESKAELSLKMGDQIRILENTGDIAGPEWLFASRVGRCGTGYVPRAYVAEQGSLECAPWFFGKITRKEAEDILRDSMIGAFLVRSREYQVGTDSGAAETQHTLSVKSKRGVKHFQIWRLADRFGGGYFVSKKRKFNTVADLIAWYKIQKNTDEFVLVEPATAKKKIPPRAVLSMDAQSRWREIPRVQIVVGKQIGRGNFGVVYEGTWNQSDGSPPKKVAIKALKQGSAAARSQFIKEAVAMKNLSHKNLVQLYGVVSCDEPYRLIQEFIKDGSLINYLQTRQKNNAPLPERSLVHIAAQIACGMRYLEEKAVVHRDLAARNVLVDDLGEDYLIIKIADFGLAKMIAADDKKQRKRVREVPTKWTAPEALDKGIYSSKSDVWSYGILLHEVFTHGLGPFEIFNNAYVRRHVVQQRQILRRHDTVPTRVYDEAMKKCFQYDPADRPTFKELYEFFNMYYGQPIDVERVSPKAKPKISMLVYKL